MARAKRFIYVARAMFSARDRRSAAVSRSRRTLAVARLAIQEAIRNRVLVGFGVFVVLLLFAGLFLDVGNSNPARVYLSFVLTTTNYLVLLMALFLSAFSLPNDIKNRTIYTVVTKPIRAGEIVLGRDRWASRRSARLMLVAMGAHQLRVRACADCPMRTLIKSTDIEPASGKDAAGRLARKDVTSTNDHHHHTFEIDEDGKVRDRRGRRRTGTSLTAASRAARRPISVGPAEGDLDRPRPGLRQL